MELRLIDRKIVNDINVAGVKVCKKCKEEYPATANYFYRAEANKDGLRCECKRCFDTANYQRRMKNLENVKNAEMAINEEKAKNNALRNIHHHLELNNEYLSGELKQAEKKNEFKLTLLIIAIFGIVAMYFYK